MEKSNQYKTALKKISQLCSRRELCVSEIVDKLAKWQLSSHEVDEIIEYLKSENYIDNLRYANAFANDKWKFQKWGKRKISYALNYKQIDEQYIRKALNNIELNAYNKMIESELTKKSRLLNVSDKYKKQHKLMQFAESRGYENELYYKIIEKIISTEK